MTATVYPDAALSYEKPVKRENETREEYSQKREDSLRYELIRASATNPSLLRLLEREVGL